jgi:hypothetical protein
LLVVVEWNSFLDAYEIKKVAPKGSRIGVYSQFTNSSAQRTTGAEDKSESESLGGGHTGEFDDAAAEDTDLPTSELRGE